MSRLYLDCEFNEFGGELISMALVSDGGREFYQVLQIPGLPGDFVEEHVLPVLGKEPLRDRTAFNVCLQTFLSHFDGCEIIADWPADFKHLSEQMDIMGKRLGFMIPIECRMTLLRGSPDIKPETPHNALSDARALRDWHQRTLRAQAVAHPFDHPPHRY